MRPNMQWRRVKAKRKRSNNILANFVHDFMSLVLSLPVISFALVVLLTITAASQPGSGLPRLFTHYLNAYAHTYKSAAAGATGPGSVIASLKCGERCNPLADKSVKKSARTTAAVESAETGPGAYISAWLTNASLAGQSIAAAAEGYRKRYLGAIGTTGNDKPVVAMIPSDLRSGVGTK